MKHNYCSVVSKDYVHKGLMLYNSLAKHDPDFEFFFICMNEDAKSLLEKMQLEKATLIPISDVERQYEELASVKYTRNEKEYAWTSKGSIFLYLFANYPELEHLVWLDSDIVFYSSPEPIFAELRECSILLAMERFVGENKKLNSIFGIYNTGLMGFKRDDNAMECIKYFKEKCIEWCYNAVVPGKWSDQMYVNDWVKRFNKVRIIRNVGINATGWNIQDCRIRKLGNELYVNDKKLVFFHYSGFYYYNDKEFELCGYIKLPEDAINLVYIPYAQEYRKMIALVNEYDTTAYREKYIGWSYNYYKIDGE
jgi:hypothetical protein